MRSGRSIIAGYPGDIILQVVLFLLPLVFISGFRSFIDLQQLHYLGRPEDPPEIIAYWSIEAASDNNWTIGDIIPLQLTVMYPKDLEILIPDLPTQWGDFEVREQETIRLYKGNNNLMVMLVQVGVTCWAPGSFPTPDLSLDYRQNNSVITNKIPVDPIMVSISSVLDQEEQEIKGLKPQAALSFSWIDAIPYFLAFFSFTILLGMIIWRVIRPADIGGNHDKQEPEGLSPSDQALVDLDLARQLANEIQYKLYYAALINNIKTYLAAVYGLSMLDKTNHEILQIIRARKDISTPADILQKLFEEASLVKFNPDVKPFEGQMADALQMASDIVTRTESLNNFNDQPGREERGAKIE